MKGKYVERRFGWDCHGLPIEHEIDKEFKMSASDAVKEFGIKKYNDECRGIVQRYTSEWEKTISRIEGGSTLKMTTKRWTPTLWNQFGGPSVSYGKKV